MRDTLNVLTNNPEIGLFTSLGSGVFHWLGVFNPILSFISLIIGIIIGLITLYGKLFK